MARYDAIRNIMKDVEDELVVCNIGLASRELYEIDDRSKNFYMMGSMGLASSIGLGLALAKPNRHVVVIDGDGSLLMNMGSMATVFGQNPDNLTWIVIDNGAYGEIRTPMPRQLIWLRLQKASDLKTPTTTKRSI